MQCASLQDDAAALVQAIGLLVRRLRAVSRPQALSLTESSVLGRLQREGPATTAELARAEGVRPQSMGSAVGVLEKAGLVARKPHPTDGRQVYLLLTEEGERTVKTAKDDRRAWVAERMAGLGDREYAALLAASETIARMAGQ